MNRINRFHRSEVRVVALLDLASAIASSEFERDYLPDLLENCVPSSIHKPHTSMQAIVDILMANEAPEDVGDCLMSGCHTGIVLEVQTPVHRDIKSESEYSYSWSICYVGYVYGETYDKALKAAADWAKSRHSRDLAKATGEQK
jgi:hypothetical protein